MMILMRLSDKLVMHRRGTACRAPTKHQDSSSLEFSLQAASLLSFEHAS